MSDHEPALETSPASPSIRPPNSYAGRGRRPAALSGTRRQRRDHRPPAKPQGRHAAAAPARTAAIPDARRRYPGNARSTRHGLPRPGPFDIAGERRGPQRRRPHRRLYVRAARSYRCAPTPADWRAAGRSRGRQRQECAVGARPIRGSPAIPWRFPPCRRRRSTVPTAAPPLRPISSRRRAGRNRSAHRHGGGSIPSERRELSRRGRRDIGRAGRSHA